MNEREPIEEKNESLATKVESDEENDAMSLDDLQESSNAEQVQEDREQSETKGRFDDAFREGDAKDETPRRANGSNYVIEPYLELRDMAKDKTLEEFMNEMDDYSPIIPDVLLDYYLSLSGFRCADPRLKKLLGLAAQKFISDIAQDAYQYSKIRTGSSSTSSAGFNAPNYGAAGASAGGPTRRGDRGKAVLTVDDLSSALNEYGINLKRPDFYR
ncbi:SAGA complex/transcription factor TFIID complex subunit Taf10 [Schizosaccharomyces cryophilus OY26]|uniref:Transcription initiation factor TFIID subunit 10 n=1 Tax=Schizosaccharomyces cryophilus (strain OY26 / ATCC MYA-4695 / CBS 11777 / NBRC 106824 / NRRL Y48691) TaxID=653667 RepID=S9W8P4_SCHCR|nr:SAGA complex/transcription factor TFIID complex subunit Taf10 [Schizosaccharomyces cryophilus OY26]EPY54260.1 SAGA complex/transcription factor TFIID complex subunit Taf10 [Schizosaccharomyces cryophilus OY26]